MELHIYTSKMESKPVPSWPSRKRWRVLITRYLPEPISSEALVQYNGVRYHLLLEYNEDVMDCTENSRLQRVHNAFKRAENLKRDEPDTSLQEQVDSLELFWPFVAERVECEQGIAEYAHVPEEKSEKSVVRIRLKTIDGSLRALEHDRILKPFPKGPVMNPYCDVHVFAQDEVEYLDEVEEGIKKARIGNGLYCVKTVLRTKGDSFLKELEKLRKIPRHPNIIHLVGVTDAGGGKIDGMVLPYLADAKPLHKLGSAVTNVLKRKWKSQIDEAVRFLHEHDIVWGDAAADNVLICGNESNAILIDFEGGFKHGWVDHELGGTKEGDLQGLRHILEFVDSLKT